MEKLKTKTAALFLVLMMITALCSIAIAQDDLEEEEDQGAFAASRMGHPRLTDEQKKQLDDLMQKYIEETVDISADLKAKTYKLGVLAMAPKIDEAGIKSLAKEIAEVRTKLFLKRVDYLLAAKKIAPQSRFIMMLMHDRMDTPPAVCGSMHEGRFKGKH